MFARSFQLLRNNPERDYHLLPRISAQITDFFLPGVPPALLGIIDADRWRETMHNLYVVLPRQFNLASCLFIRVPFCCIQNSESHFCQQYLATPCVPNRRQISRYLHREQVTYYRLRGVRITFFGVRDPVVVDWSRARLRTVTILTELHAKQHKMPTQPGVPLSQADLHDLFRRYSQRRPPRPLASTYVPFNDPLGLPTNLSAPSPTTGDPSFPSTPLPAFAAPTLSLDTPASPAAAPPVAPPVSTALPARERFVLGGADADDDEEMRELTPDGGRGGRRGLLDRLGLGWPRPRREPHVVIELG
ncbi:hypothetical protein PAPYR_2561 [Paratrimastix pyriformis]|uniref:Uncharacterized protein n=1 Tax=Paratrimastix pyriformis TaxID=342808 RepID=A0ABQ8UPM9_9EUKA|nr:hypothetical protein PAPYR_2561 [Paratrimastix pyriformis]